MIAGGSESAFVQVALIAFGQMTALATKFNDRPTEASRPFDALRNGFVMGEGAGALILEEREHALARGAPSTPSWSASASRPTPSTSPPRPRTAAGPPWPCGGRCARPTCPRGDRLRQRPRHLDPDRGRVRDQGHPPGLRGPRRPAGRLLDQVDDRAPVRGGRRGRGHRHRAGGAGRILPPTINQTDPDPACDLDYVPNQARKADVDAAMSNGFGFGGHNAVVVFRRHQASTPARA